MRRRSRPRQMRVAASKVSSSSSNVPLWSVFGSQLPDQALAQTVAGFVFQKEEMILGWRRAGSPIMPHVLLLVVDREHRHGRELGVRREKTLDVHHGAERDIAQIRRSAMIPHNAIGKHGEGLRVIAVKLSLARHAEASAAVGMIDEDQFAAIGVGFFQRRKFSRLGAKGFICSRDGGERQNEQGSPKKECTIHIPITLLLSPKWSVSSPIF